MDEEIQAGTERMIDGRLRVFYDGYWIKAYPVPADTLLEKRRLIAALTRRLFNHVEHGINVPGERLDEVDLHLEGHLFTEPNVVRALAALPFHRERTDHDRS